jgi:hypothetical protein
MSAKKKAPSTSSLPKVDRLDNLVTPTLDDFIAAASDYITNADNLNAGQAKAAQLKLSNALGRAVLAGLKSRLPGFSGIAGEHNVGGALRAAQADVHEFLEPDGLRLAIEIKPVHKAVGRAIWNRFGDIRTFAVNVHLKFPFAVVGGVMTVPTVETSKAEKYKTNGGWKPTTAQVSRAVERFRRAGSRLTESDAPHQLEAIAFIVFDPRTQKVHAKVPPKGSNLRWDEFLDSLATAYNARFEGSTVGTDDEDTDDLADEDPDDHADELEG